MSRVFKVFKYPLKIGDDNRIKMPKGSRLLTVHEQDGEVMVWALVDESQPVINRWIVVHGTGHSIEADRLPLFYVGTAFVGPFVWHVFDRGE